MLTKIRGYEVWLETDEAIIDPFAWRVSPVRGLLFPRKDLAERVARAATRYGFGETYVREWAHTITVCTHHDLIISRVLEPSCCTGLFVGRCPSCGSESFLPHICSSGVKLEMNTFVLTTVRAKDRYDPEAGTYYQSVYDKLIRQYRVIHGKVEADV